MPYNEEESPVTVVKINAITVPDGRGPELEQRFAQRARDVERMPGFIGFQLLRPRAGESRYFVLTEWASEEAFREWVQSEAFRREHARVAGPGGPVATHADLLEFEVALSSGRYRDEHDHSDGPGKGSPLPTPS